MSGPLKEYEVEVNGVKSTLLLNEEDAKARAEADKAAEEQRAQQEKAAAAVDKARQAQNKKA